MQYLCPNVITVNDNHATVDGGTFNKRNEALTPVSKGGWKFRLKSRAKDSFLSIS
jgi:hypothetical protein